DPATQSGNRIWGEGHRPDWPDPGNFRRTRRDGRGAVAGRTGASRLPGGPPRAELDPPRTPARRLRLSRRSRRNPDRGRPADDPQPHGADPQTARRGAANAQVATRETPTRALAGGRAGWLYQRRKIYFLQPPDGK